MKLLSIFKDKNMKMSLALLLVVLFIIFLYLFYFRKNREGAGVLTRFREMRLRRQKNATKRQSERNIASRKTFTKTQSKQRERRRINKQQAYDDYSNVNSPRVGSWDGRSMGAMRLRKHRAGWRRPLRGGEMPGPANMPRGGLARPLRPPPPTRTQRGLARVARFGRNMGSGIERGVSSVLGRAKQALVNSKGYRKVPIYDDVKPAPNRTRSFIRRPTNNQSVLYADLDLGPPVRKQNLYAGSRNAVNNNPDSDEVMYTEVTYG